VRLALSDIDMPRREIMLRHMKKGDTRMVPMTPDIVTSTYRGKARAWNQPFNII
jgi:hypothetical protein